MDYKNGKIYKLQCDDGHFYIGSTVSTLVKRFGQHKCRAKKTPEQRVYKHIDGKWDSVRIVLIEEFPCENKNQLVRKEDEHIRLHREDALCLNSNMAFRTKEDDNAKNKAYCKTYYDAHKEDIRAKQKAYYLRKKQSITIPTTDTNATETSNDRRRDFRGDCAVRESTRSFCSNFFGSSYD